MPPLRTMGLISDDGTPTERARKWRLDDQYSEVCQEILQEIYPSSLLEAFAGPDPDRTQVQGWFMAATGRGEGAAKQMSQTFLLLNEPTPRSSTESARASNKGGSTQRTREPKLRVTNRHNGEQKAEPEMQTNDGFNRSDRLHDASPTLHIDLQIHISPEASPEQIDQIFESMGKHLYKR